MSDLFDQQPDDATAALRVVVGSSILVFFGLLILAAVLSLR